MTARHGSQLPMMLDLIADGLRAGRPLSAALLSVTEVYDDPYVPALRRIGGLIGLGADTEFAWRSAADLSPPGRRFVATNAAFAAMGRFAQRGTDSGMAMADSLVELAERLRRGRRAEARRQAARTALWGLLPLTTCFLPAFLCIGIGPMLLGLARQLGGVAG